MRKYQPASKIMVKASPGFKEETCYDTPFFIADESSYKDFVLEHVSDCLLFRKKFIGNGHQLFSGVLDKWGPVIISLLKTENADSPKNPGERETIYQVIVRFREVWVLT